jgi:hypothetical protein
VRNLRLQNDCSEWLKETVQLCTVSVVQLTEEVTEKYFTDTASESILKTNSTEVFKTKTFKSLSKSIPLNGY